MRFDIDTFLKTINIYDFDPIDGVDFLLYSKQYENAIDFHGAIKYIFSKTTSELRTEIIEINRKKIEG